MKYISFFLISCLVTFVFGFTQGQNPIDQAQGLQSGEKAPLFEAVNQYGETVRLSDLLTKSPVLLVFYRGYWCPICNRHLQLLQDNLGKLEQAGVKIVAISPEVPERIAKTVEKTQAGFDVLHDEDLKIGLAYDVIFSIAKADKIKYNTFLGAALEEANSDGSERLPIPATYLIDQTGNIAYRHFDPDYKQRSTIEDILAALEKLQDRN